MTGQYRTFIFDVREIIGLLTQSMVFIKGPMAVSNNYASLVKVLTESILYPYTDYPRDVIYHEFQCYEVAREEAEPIAANAIAGLVRLLGGTFHNTSGDHLFDVEVDRHGNLRISDLGALPAEQSVGIEDLYQRMINQDIEDGHWVPPKMRRLVGLS